MKNIIGLFKHEYEADAAIVALQRAGFGSNNLGAIAPNSVVQKVNRQEDVEQGSIQADDKLGASGGAAIGGLMGLLLGLGAVVIPGIGPVLAAGTIASALGLTAASTGMGLIAGGLLGALTSLGISEEEAQAYDEGVKQGGILVVVAAEEAQAAQVREIMGQHGAVEVNTQRQEVGS